MEKLLHERLQEVEEYGVLSCVKSLIGEADCPDGSCQECVMRAARILKDHIEKYYDPKPRDTEGNPVHKDMEVDGGIVDDWNVHGSGRWYLYDKSKSVPIQYGNRDDLIQLPKPKVFDADGVEINIGDTVWGKYSGVEHEVLGFDTCDGLLCVRIRNVETGSIGGASPNLLTLKKPDSLEKLRDDMVSAYNDWQSDPNTLIEFADRLTDLMERDV